jgi:hypothetical protein
MEAMSEFKFACPVCGQHITADSSTTGAKIECPTCFRSIVVPQAPASPDSKFILSASQVAGPRPVPSAPEPEFSSAPAKRFPVAGVALALMLCATGAAAFVFRDKLFSTSTRSSANSQTNLAPKFHLTYHPVPTNFVWTLDLTETVYPAATPSGRLRGNGFLCDRATLQGGKLTLRQSNEMGFSVAFFAHQGEDLAGKTLVIAANRARPLPRVDMRWKEDPGRFSTRSFYEGYALKAEFGQANEGRMAGKIYLSLPDEAKSFVAGTFDAEILKPGPHTARTTGQ